MKQFSRLSGTLLLSLIALACLTACPSPYGPGLYPSDGSTIGTITRIAGTGEVRINDRGVHEGAVMLSGDHIQTVGYARATLALARGGEVFFDADTDPVLEWMSAALCRLRILINVGSILVDTPCETEAETGSGAVINTLGTTFHLAVTPEWTALTVIQGRMTIRSNVGGRQVVPAGFQCRVLRDRPAPRPVRVDTRRVIDWACRLDRRLCRDERPPRSDVSVPNLVGIELDLARRTLARYDLNMGQVREKATDRRADDGRVAAQSPKQGARVPTGAQVDLFVWRYRAGITEMPMLLNRPLREAKSVLENAGVRLGRVEEVITRDPGQADRVARQAPRAGTRIRPGTTADLAVYRYERPRPTAAKVPRLTGMHIDKARAELERAGLRLGRTFTEPAPSKRQNGFVLRQKPGAGSNISPGGAVDVWVYRTGTPRPSDLHRLPQMQ